MQTQRIASLIYTLDSDTDLLSNIQIIPEPDNMEVLGCCVAENDKPTVVCTHLHVNKGLAADIDCRGEMYVEGGTVERVRVSQGGSLLALRGKILHVSEVGGDVDTGAFEGEIVFDPVKWSATRLDAPASVHKGNVCYNTTVTHYGVLFVYNGGHAHDLEFYEGDLEVLSGGDAFNVVLHAGGDCTVENSGCIRNVVVEKGARLHVKDGAKAFDVTVKEGGRLVVGDGATTDRIVVENGGHVERK